MSLQGKDSYILGNTRDSRTHFCYCREMCISPDELERAKQSLLASLKFCFRKTKGKPQLEGVPIMARTKSEFLGSLGTTFQIFKTIADAVMEEGGSDEDLRKILLPSNGLAKNLALVITGKADVILTPASRTV